MDRNAHLNPAFQPKWNPVNDPQAASLVAMNPKGDTRFDPFEGTPWGHFFDSLNGARVGKGSLSTLPDSPPAPSILPSERIDLQGPFGGFGMGTGGQQPDGTGTGGNVPTGVGPQTEGPYGRLTAATKGIRK